MVQDAVACRGDTKEVWIETWMSEPEPVPGGRSRKRVRLTEVGIDAVRRARARLDRMAEGLDGILGEA